MKKLLLLTLCLGLTFTSCNLSSKKEEKKETLLPENSEESLKRTTQKTKNCRVFKPNERKKYKDAKKQNLDVLQGESYYDLSNKYVMIKTPVKFDDYKIYSTHWFTQGRKKGLFIGISNGTATPTRTEELGSFILEKKINFSSIKGNSLNLKKSDKLNVIIFNDDSYTSSKPIKFEDIIDHLNFNEDLKVFVYTQNNIAQPREAGGGVIIVGP